MTKKEKIISISFIFSMLLLIASCILTLYQNKPENSHFAIENQIKSILR